MGAFLSLAQAGLFLPRGFLVQLLKETIKTFQTFKMSKLVQLLLKNLYSEHVANIQHLRKI